MDKNRLATIEERCTRTLIGLLNPLLMKVYQDLYDEVLLKKDIRPHERLAEFQRALKATPLWNSLEIQKRVDLIISEIPDLMEVLEAVFMVNAQLWGSVRFGSTMADDDITLQLPTKGDFVHKLIIKGAEKIYEDPHLFDHRLSQRDMRENRKVAGLIIEEACHYTLDKCFPRGEILKKFLTMDNDTPQGGGASKAVDDDALSDSGSDVSEDASVGDEGDIADDNEPPSGQLVVSDSDSDDSEDESEAQVKKISTSMNRSDFGASDEGPVLPPPPETSSVFPPSPGLEAPVVAQPQPVSPPVAQPPAIDAQPAPATEEGGNAASEADY